MCLCTGIVCKVHAVSIGKIDMCQYQRSLHYAVEFALSCIVFIRQFLPSSDTLSKDLILDLGDDTAATVRSETRRAM